MSRKKNNFSNIIAYCATGSLDVIFHNYVTGDFSPVIRVTDENVTNFQSALTPNGYAIFSWFDSNGQFQTKTIYAGLTQSGGDPLLDAIKSYCPVKKLKGIRLN